MGGMVLLCKYHSLMSEMLINSTYGWVNIENERAIKVYMRFGYEFDTYKNYIYFRH